MQRRLSQRLAAALCPVPGLTSGYTKVLAPNFENSKWRRRRMKAGKGHREAVCFIILASTAASSAVRILRERGGNGVFITPVPKVL